jgi:uroporphyrinogen-III decarboxylase
MDFKERFLTAMNHEEPDRVPVMGLVMDPATSNSVLNKKPVDFVSMLKKPALKNIIKWLLNTNWYWNKMFTGVFDDALKSSVKLGFDANWIIYAYMKLHNDPESKLGISWYDQYGRIWELDSDEDGNMAVNYSRALLDTEERWDAWVEEKAPMFAKGIKNVEKFTKILTEKYRDSILPIGYAAPGIWENSWQPVGFVEFTKYIYKNKNFVKKVIDFHTDLYLKNLEAVCSSEVEVVIGGDDVGHKTGPLMNPKTFDELYGESYRKVSDYVHKKGKKILWHSCGRIYKFLDYFVEWGFDGIITMEPTADMDLERVREHVGHKLVLVGNLDVSYLLVRGTKDEIETEVKNCIKKAAKGGGYVLSACHSHPYVDPKRMKWMIDAAHKYGKYPISL